MDLEWWLYYQTATSRIILRTTIMVIRATVLEQMRPSEPECLKTIVSVVWYLPMQKIKTGMGACDVGSSFVITCRMNSCHAASPGSSTTTPGWTPAGSWTGWWWPTWTGPTCASVLPATTGWVGRRLTTCMSETCWAAWIPWMSQNVGHSGTNTQHKSDTKGHKGCKKIRAD